LILIERDTFPSDPGFRWYIPFSAENCWQTLGC